MMIEPHDVVLLLPAQTRYEQSGGGTETSTERRILFSPEIPGRRIGEARPEWEIPMLIAERAKPESARLIHFDQQRDPLNGAMRKDALVSEADAQRLGFRTSMRWSRLSVHTYDAL
jgi:hypothetical protein